MNNQFITLDCDDDVVLFQKDTFKVSRLKELVREQICSKWERHSAFDHMTQKTTTQISEFLKEISLNQEIIKIDEIKLNLIIDCQILKISGKGWQKGKLKMQIYISNVTTNKYTLYLEFCSDEAVKPELPLDDIRKILEVR
ncbi:KGK domain-containing protein [Nostoc sp.]|uniref:KGK domain-containing protein n=1 Tax=Nostoc sp. TaxID=1180 RepID=UPI002FFBA7C4